MEISRKPCKCLVLGCVRKWNSFVRVKNVYAIKKSTIYRSAAQLYFVSILTVGEIFVLSYSSCFRYSDNNLSCGRSWQYIHRLSVCVHLRQNMSAMGSTD